MRPGLQFTYLRGKHLFVQKNGWHLRNITKGLINKNVIMSGSDHYIYSNQLANQVLSLYLYVYFCIAGFICFPASNKMHSQYLVIFTKGGDGVSILQMIKKFSWYKCVSGDSFKEDPKPPLQFFALKQTAKCKIRSPCSEVRIITLLFCVNLD